MNYSGLARVIYSQNFTNSLTRTRTKMCKSIYDKQTIVFIGENRMWHDIRLMQHLGLGLFYLTFAVGCCVSACALCPLKIPGEKSILDITNFSPVFG